MSHPRMIKPRTALGTFMTQARIDMGLSIHSLAHRAGYSPGTVRNWELGITEPRGQKFENWCQALGVDPAEVNRRTMWEAA
jgi:transcriptional regulator with XRE-family HTH domain